MTLTPGLTFSWLHLTWNVPPINEHKCPKTMQIEKSITSDEPRNISSTMFGIKKYHEHSFSFLWTQKSLFTIF